MWRHERGEKNFSNGFIAEYVSLRLASGISRGSFDRQIMCLFESIFSKYSWYGSITSCSNNRYRCGQLGMTRGSLGRWQRHGWLARSTVTGLCTALRLLKVPCLHTTVGLGYLFQVRTADGPILHKVYAGALDYARAEDDPN